MAPNYRDRALQARCSLWENRTKSARYQLNDKALGQPDAAFIAMSGNSAQNVACILASPLQ